MGKIYDQLSIEERVVIQIRLEMGVKPGAIAVGLGRPLSEGWLLTGRLLAHWPLCIQTRLHCGYRMEPFTPPSMPCPAASYAKK